MSYTFNSHDDSSMISLNHNCSFPLLKVHKSSILRTQMEVSPTHYGLVEFFVVKKPCLENRSFPSAMWLSSGNS